VAYDFQELWNRCIQAASLRIAELPLGIPTDAIRTGKVVDLTGATFPAVFITVEGCSAEIALHDTGTDETTLPVRVVYMDRQSERDASLLPAWLRVRMYISGAFRARSMAAYGVPEAWRVDVRPANAYEGKTRGGEYQHAVGADVLRFRCLTPRVTF